MISLAKYSAVPTSLAMSFVLIISFLWCSDPGCSSDKECDGCASLICTLLQSLNDPSDHSPEPGAENCSCVAQIPLLASSPLLINVIVQSGSVLIIDEARLLSLPNGLIFRPPIV